MIYLYFQCWISGRRILWLFKHEQLTALYAGFQISALGKRTVASTAAATVWDLTGFHSLQTFLKRDPCISFQDQTQISFDSRLIYVNPVLFRNRRLFPVVLCCGPILTICKINANVYVYLDLGIKSSFNTSAILKWVKTRLQSRLQEWNTRNMSPFPSTWKILAYSEVVWILKM